MTNEHKEIIQNKKDDKRAAILFFILAVIFLFLLFVLGGLFLNRNSVTNVARPVSAPAVETSLH